MKLEQQLLECNKKISCLAINHESNIIAATTTEPIIRIWEKYDQWVMTHTLEGHIKPIQTISFWKDKLASGGWDKVIRIWDLKTWECVYELHHHTLTVWNISFMDNLITSTRDQFLRVYNSDTFQFKYSIYNVETKWMFAVSTNRNVIVVRFNEKWIKIYYRNRCVIRFLAHDHWISQLVFNKDSSILASASADYSIKLWTTKNWTCLHKFKDHQHVVRQIQFSPDGQLLASSSMDLSLIIRRKSINEQYETEQVIQKVNIPTLLFSKDSKILIFADDKTISIYN